MRREELGAERERRRGRADRARVLAEDLAGARKRSADGRDRLAPAEIEETFAEALRDAARHGDALGLAGLVEADGHVARDRTLPSRRLEALLHAPAYAAARARARP